MIRLCTALTLLALLLPAAAAFAQANRNTPARPIDSLTGTISGRITSAETGAPVRRAEVRATSERGVSRLATTDGDGRYVVRDLPEGTFTLHVSKSGFVPLYFGQRRPFERRTTIPLKEGERFSADVALRRAGAITGRVVDRAGEPVMGARVQALRRMMVQGQRGLQAVGVSDTTDDTGAYRVYALPPGDYYVFVAPRGTAGVGRGAGASAGLAVPIFYPGTANSEEAQRVAVDVAGEARADMQLVDVRASSVSGVVLTSAGSPAAGAMLTLRSHSFGMSSAMPTEFAALQAIQQLRDDAAADGSFTIEGVPPGAYTLSVQTRPPMPLFVDPATLRAGNSPLLSMETASIPVAVDGDVGGLTVTTNPGGTLDVEFVRAEGVTRQLPSNVRFSIRMSGRNETATLGSLPNAGRVRLDLAQPASIDVEGLPEDWMVKAILLDNEDVTDAPIQVKGGTATARIVLTDRVTEITGSVAPASFGDTRPQPPAMVVAFSDDEKKWTYPSRYIRVARTDAKGGFRILGLPPDTYRFAALDYLEDGEETDAGFLAKLRDRATRMPLGEGERAAVDLRLIQR